MKPSLGSLLGINQLTTAQIESILALARRMDPNRPSQLLRGKRVVLLFYEASTRTRTSFEFAAKALGATTTLVTATSSSIEKGESLIDTGWTVECIGADVIVMRHPNSGSAHLLARYVSVPVVNAGDGMHQHPSQALLDALTMLNHKKNLRGLRVVIVGDVYHSRVARSNAELLSRFGAHVILCGPPDFVPEVAATLAPGVTVSHDLNAALQGADVVMALRVQKERLLGQHQGVEAYVAHYQVTPRRMLLAKPDAILMHPGPVIRGMELTSEVADGPQSCIHEQVRNGVKTRMAILAMVLAGA
ncbi:MAG TPA: aspartate carbamoyltransferase catalytic subunit [Candidatus Binatia bacterium]|nr:aspartate carbamoyltransferase catalytic subunit [Candidatus Binatia bacterium]